MVKMFSPILGVLTVTSVPEANKENLPDSIFLLYDRIKPWKSSKHLLRADVYSFNLTLSVTDPTVKKTIFTRRKKYIKAKQKSTMMK